MLKKIGSFGKLIKDEKGVITIYLVIVFLAMIVFVGLFVDLARITVAQNQLRRVANASARSVLADYDTKTKQEFGLFAFVKGNGECDGDFEKYIRLNISSSMGKEFNLMDYRFEESSARLTSPLIQRETLKRQILEDMKYIAPVELTVFVADKIGSISRMFQFFGTKNSQRKRLDHIRIKQQEIKKTADSIEQKKNQLVQHQRQVEEKQKALSREQDPEARARIKDEITQLETQINDLKIQVKADLETCRQLNQEIQNETVTLTESGYMSKTDTDETTSDSVGSRIKETEDSMNRKVGEIQTAIDQTSAEVSRDIQKSLSALDRGDYEQIGLWIANVYLAESMSEQQANERMMVDQQNALETQVAESVYSDCLGAFTIKEISNNPSDFEKYNGKDIEEILQNTEKILSIKDILINARDDIYINEYIVTHFSHLTQPTVTKNPLYEFYNSEAEFICFENSPRLRAIGEIYLIRFGLDTMAYLCFSKAPVEPLSRFVYSAIMGAIQAAVDTFKLVLGQTVAIAEMIDPANPLNSNPLEDIRTDYKEHLRLLLFLNNDENQKLDRILKVIKARNSVEPSSLNTVVTGTVQISIKLWFLPLAGLDDFEKGPFGTAIRDGRCYISKTVEYGY